MNLASLKTKANGKLVEFWDLLLPKQEAFFLKHGTFFQLLVTPPVVDGADTTFAVIKSGHEPYTADVDFTFNSPIPFSISVDEWVGKTRGFSITATVELLDGRKFTRRREAVPITIEDPNDSSKAIVSDWTVNTSNWAEIIEETL